MRKFISLLIVGLLFGLTATAQPRQMRVTKTDGTTLLIGIDEIESIDFPELYNLALNTSKWCLHPGGTLHLELYTVEGTDQIGQVADSWESSDESVCTVDREGVVTAVAEGTAVVSGCLGDGRASASIKVTAQKAFAMSVTDITNNSCSYSITPADPDVRYYYNMRNLHGEYSIDAMTDYGSTEENIYYFTRDWYQFVAEQYGDRSWNDAMQPQLDKGPKSGTHADFYKMLEPGTEYALYAIGFDADGFLTTPVEMLTFETTAPQQSTMTFDITIDRCLSTDAMFTVTPSTNDETYLVCVQSGDRYVNWFIENDKVESMAQPMIEQYASDSRYPAVNRGPVTLKASDFVNPRSGEDYYVIVFGYNDGQTTPITLKRFRTESGWTEPEADIIDVTPPASLVTVDCVFTAYDYYLDENDEVVYEPFDPMAGEIGSVGNEVYMRGMLGKMTDKWMKGTFDAQANTVTFQSPQYMGQFDFYGEGAENFYVCGGNLDTDEMCPLVFDYDPATGRFTLRSNVALVVNGKPFDWYVHMMMLNVGIQTENPLF